MATVKTEAGNREQQFHTRERTTKEMEVKEAGAAKEKEEKILTVEKVVGANDGEEEVGSSRGRQISQEEEDEKGTRQSSSYGCIIIPCNS